MGGPVQVQRVHCDPQSTQPKRHYGIGARTMDSRGRPPDFKFYLHYLLLAGTPSCLSFFIGKMDLIIIPASNNCGEDDWRVNKSKHLEQRLAHSWCPMVSTVRSSSISIYNSVSVITQCKNGYRWKKPRESPERRGVEEPALWICSTASSFPWREMLATQEYGLSGKKRLYHSKKCIEMVWFHQLPIWLMGCRQSLDFPYKPLSLW